MCPGMAPSFLSEESNHLELQGQCDFPQGCLPSKQGGWRGQRLTQRNYLLVAPLKSTIAAPCGFWDANQTLWVKSREKGANLMKTTEILVPREEEVMARHMVGAPQTLGLAFHRTGP